ncbi:osteopontin isoform X1 [Anabas testudineus]|uniref:Secreted phosphoprotein 1 n=1 Tax=Anabas testudineus TaxID=64144 RepID=A0A3Q1HKX4_ANATE|nr:osteopontin isoform X1 [Anabas testudineus]
MKVAVIFILLFATVLCRPAKKVSDSSESSEEVVRRPAPQAIKKKAPVAPQVRVSQVQNVVAAAAEPAAAESDESKESSDEEKAPEAPVEVKSGSTASASDSTSDTTSVTGNNSDSEDDDNDDDETEETEEKEEEEEEEESSSESGESSTPAPTVVNPVVITDAPVAETTVEPIEPTIVTDTDTARGDNLGGPSDYKSIIYVEDKSYHKIPVPYKSYEFVGTGKKVAYDMTYGNEVEKSMKVQKALQVHSDLLEEGTSTHEEGQALDSSSGTLDLDPSHRQASIPEEESTSTSEASTSDTTSESSSTPDEEEENDETASTDSDSSTSQESEDEEESQSSEEGTATPGAADSDSDESDSDENESDNEEVGPDTTTDMPQVVTAK